MAIDPDKANVSEAAEQELANLLARLGDEIGRGEEVSLEEVCKEYPQFETDLRELWGTVVVTQAAGLDQSTNKLESDSISVLELPFQLGNYMLHEELGRGGMGIVYRATRLTDGLDVAIKMMLKGDFASDIDRQRFYAEADAAARLHHPNIVPILEIGEHKGRSFFCMKLVIGLTLSERLARGPIPSRRAATILQQVAEAIDYAHDQGVLHRDLKPSNILLDDEGVPYVADFGLAKLDRGRASLTKTGAVLGTPSYMAPEQAAGARGTVGQSSDIYSLGAILYHMLTGKPPFLGATPVDTVLMVLEQDPVAPYVLNRRVDRMLEMVAMRCMQKPQDLRYSTAGDLAADLGAFLRNEPMAISARVGRFGQVVSKLLRDTHHASVLENWGLLWMWHSLVLLIASVATNVMHLNGYDNRVGYWLMWTFGLGTWAIVFWCIRRRMGPVTFVERQIAHVWAASMCCVAFFFPLEVALGLPVLSLAPLLAVVAGMTFLVKAGILSGVFYIQAGAMFVTAVVMAIAPKYGLTKFGIVSGACFFLSGLKYYRRRQHSLDSQQ